METFTLRGLDTFTLTRVLPPPPPHTPLTPHHTHMFKSWFDIEDAWGSTLSNAHNQVNGLGKWVTVGVTIVKWFVMN